MHRSYSGGTAASGTEGRAVGFAFGARSFVLNIDSGRTALVVNGIILAVGYVASDAGVDLSTLFLAHRMASIRLLFHT